MLTKSEKAMNAMHELDLNNNLSNHSIAKTKWILQELELASSLFRTFDLGEITTLLSCFGETSVAVAGYADQKMVFDFQTGYCKGNKEGIGNKCKSGYIKSR